MTKTIRKEVEVEVEVAGQGLAVVAQVWEAEG